MPSLPEKREEELIAKFLLIEDPQERLQALIGRKRATPILAPERQEDATLVKECSSPLWLDGHVGEGKLFLALACPAPLVLGLAGVACDLCHEAPVQEVAAFEPRWLERLGFSRFVSETRQRGLAAVHQRILSLASRQPIG